jgi:class 3 adenylate cyclase/tetratricopeptide (TPR) repeat protein
MAHDVFISYASADKATADAVCQALEAAAIPCWIAPRDVVAGTRYAEAIVDAIREAKVFVLVFSAAASASIQVEREVDRAASLGLPIVPFRIEGVEPSDSLEYYLAGKHWLDALTPPLEKHLPRLVAAVQRLTAAAAGEAAHPGPPRGEGAATHGVPSTAAVSRQERKVVTTVICDLVGFTSMSERADPEDVDRLLEEYSERARKEIEAHGGTLEKFIGDAVVGVFGVPSVHEDDPERAVRAGLRLIEALEGMARPDGSPLQARIGINTGEALVRLDVDPASGRGFLTGDAVNVAARLQAAAPPGGVAVGALTYELTAGAIQYGELPAVTAKGKAAPVAAWLAKAPVARVGVDIDRAQLTPLVGREVELAFLHALLKKAVSAAAPQFAVLLGEPGIGKSRLVQELYADVDARPEMITWRQGHCLPYGENVTFWALDEIVKAHAGILESDGREAVETKLDAVVPRGEDREWLRNRLRALLGLEAPSASRDENFAAWLRFLEEIAASNPTVLVFEDLHWADEALLAFVEHLATHVAGVPLLVVATARPELLEQHPTFAAGSTHVNRLSVDPLAPDETQQLVAELLGDTEALSDTVADIVASCEGNPFFAEQSARLVADQVRQAPVPASVQAVLAARLDALPPAHKAMLSDAAVVGSVFWDGVVVEVGHRDAVEVDAALQDLIGKHLVRRVRHSSMLGENEFAFAHALAREVAYQELPRAVRATRHKDVAEWVESKAGDRVEDLAEILAHHYATALDLARAAGDDELADSLVEPATRCLELAGDRAWPLDVVAAERQYVRALEIAGPESPRRSALLVRWGKALTQLGRGAEAVGPLEEAIARLKAASDVRAAAVAQMGLARVLPHEAGARWLEPADEAVASLEADGPSRELVTVLKEWLKLTITMGDYRKQLEVAERAMELSQRLGLSADAELLVSRGCARCDLGLAGGDEDLRKALAMCRASGLSEHLSWVFTGVSNWMYIYEGFQATLAIAAEGLDFARRRGAVELETDLRVVVVWASQATGDWDRVLDEAVAIDPLLESALESYNLSAVRGCRTIVLVERGRALEAAKLVEWIEQRALDESTAKDEAACSIAAAAACMALGEPDRTLDHLSRSEAALRGKGGYWDAEWLPRAVRIALVAGDHALAERLAGSLEPLQPISCHAIVAVQALVSEARGDYEAAATSFADAASRWHDFAAHYEEAQALLGQGRCLVALGRAPEAAGPLTTAREIFTRLGAKPPLAETDELMLQVASA